MVLLRYTAQRFSPNHVMCPPPLCGRAAPSGMNQGERLVLGNITLQRLEPVQQGGVGLPEGFSRNPLI